MIRSSIILGIFLALLFSLNLPPISAQEAGYCYRFNCYDSASHEYNYVRAACTSVELPGGVQYDYLPNTGNVNSLSALNTNVVGTWPTANEPDGCFSPPSACNQGFYAENIPTCSGGTGGTGGGGCSPACNANGAECSAQSSQQGSCPANWLNRDCADVPCAYRSNTECGCSACLHGCSPTCTGGGCTGSPTPTPTPTPTPYCNLQCPGTPISQFDGSTLTVPNASMGIFTALGTGGAGGGGAGGSVNGTQTSRVLAQAAGGGGAGGSASGTTHSCGDISQALATDPNQLTFGYGEVRGSLTYNGYNSFSCSAVHGCTDSEACPAPTIVVKSPTEQGNVAGASTQRLSFGSMIKNFTQRLLAQSAGGGAGGGSAGGGAGGGSASGVHTTWTTTKAVNRLNGSTPTLYGYTAKDATGQGCSCQIVLGCQQAQQASPNSAEMEISTCESQCTFSVDSATEYPEVGDSVTFNYQANEGFERRVSMNYDDGTTVDLAEPYPGTGTHTFTNAGTYDITLSCTNNGGNGKSCTRRLNVYCAGTGVLLTPTPTPPPSWSKFKDAALTFQTAPSNTAPSGAIAYDATDTGICDRSQPTSIECISSGQAGSTTVLGATANFGVRLSDRQWLRTDPAYASNELLTPSSFIEYARARKDVVELQSVTPETIVPGKINIFTGNLVITDNAIPDSITAGEKVVLVVDGTVSLDLSADPADTFNPDNKPFAVIATGETEISAGTTEINGIFITNTVDFAYDATPSTTTPLKINGNLTFLQASTACADKRVRGDSTYMPSCFMTFDFANQYAPLIDLLSTRTYEWTELVP